MKDIDARLDDMVRRAFDLGLHDPKRRSKAAFLPEQMNKPFRKMLRRVYNASFKAKRKAQQITGKKKKAI